MIVNARIRHNGPVIDPDGELGNGIGVISSRDQIDNEISFVFSASSKSRRENGQMSVKLAVHAFLVGFRRNKCKRWVTFGRNERCEK